MDSCSFCFQLCLLCLESPSLDCPICKQLQYDHRKLAHTPLASNSNYNPLAASTAAVQQHVDPANLDLFTSQKSAEILPEASFALPTPSDPPASRRREWTDQENCDFERWITSNPKPTKQQKQDFANQHTLLTLSHVQNKINNWRSGRNIQRKQLQSSTPEELVPPCTDTLPEIFQGLDWDLSCLGQLESLPNYTSNYNFNENENTSYPNEGSIECLDVTLAGNGEPEPRLNSPVSSISRYMSCPDLEANREDIEMTIRKASQEDLLKEDLPSECMRLPSLKRQAVAQFELNRTEDESKWGFCTLCKELDWQCNRELPCYQCNEIGVPCSNCLPLNFGISNYIDLALLSVRNRNGNEERNISPGPQLKHQSAGNESQGPTSKLDHPRDSLDQVRSTPPVALKTKSTSRAQSVTSAKTSHSGRSTQSARYSIKLNRRISANNRRFSASVIPPTSSKAIETFSTNHTRTASLQDAPDGYKSQASPRKSILDILSSRTEDRSQLSTSMNVAGNRAGSSRKSVSSVRVKNGRDDYFNCPNCTEIFQSEFEKHLHERASHSVYYCTFCNLSFRDRTTWHGHERSHMRIIYKECDNCLWRCGICSTYGLGDSRRYMHIRGHWEDKCTPDDWKGGPQMMPLAPGIVEALETMSDELFEINAEKFLSVFLKESFESAAELPTAENKQRNTDTAGNLADRAVDTSQQMTHGLFASLRRKIPLFRARPH